MSMQFSDIYRIEWKSKNESSAANCYLHLERQLLSQSRSNLCVCEYYLTAFWTELTKKKKRYQPTKMNKIIIILRADVHLKSLWKTFYSNYVIFISDFFFSIFCSLEKWWTNNIRWLEFNLRKSCIIANSMKSSNGINSACIFAYDFLLYQFLQKKKK